MEHKEDNSEAVYGWTSGAKALPDGNGSTQLFGGRRADLKPLTKLYTNFEEMARDSMDFDPNRL